MTDGAPLPVPARTTRPRRGARAVPRPVTTARHARRRTLSPRVAAVLLRGWTTWVPALALVLGAYARLRQWAGGRSLWLDEVLIADNLVRRGFIDLVREPLLHSQAAPPIWLWFERLGVDLFGTSERSLRLVPLLAGLAVLALALPFARRLLPRVLVPIPVVVIALHPDLIYYSNEVKQYSTDVLAVLVLLLLAFRVRSGAGDGPPLRRLALAGAVAVWFSYASIFVLAGVSVVLVLNPLRQRDVRRAVRMALVLCIWVASLAVEYLLLLRRLTSNQPLADYWRPTYPHGAGDLPAWFVRRLLDLADNPLALTWPWLGLLLLGFGLVRMSRETGRRAALLWGAAPAALCAAALSAYPFAGRLALWLVPLAAVTLAAAMPHQLLRGRTAWLLLGSAALTISLAPAAASGLALTTKTQHVEELRPLLERFAQARQPGDLAYVEVATRDPFEYYAERTGVSRDGVILFLSREEQLNCSDLAALNAGRFATERVWIISGHRLSDTARLGSIDDMLGRIRTVSREVAHLHETNADAWLFDPSTGAEHPEQRGQRNDDRCLTIIRSSR